MPLPTFVIVGAQKCGTSSLSATLRRHPQIQMSKPKELHYFDRPKDRPLEWYANQFRPQPRHLAWGEGTPVYMYDSTARDRLVETLPDAKLIVMFRDPVKRAYSHYWHNRRIGSEQLDTFEAALDQEESRLASGTRIQQTRFSYVDRGRYVDQIEALEAAVGRERLHVAMLDDLISDRVATLEAIFEFLSVDLAPASTIEQQHTNKYRVTDADGNKVIVDYPTMSAETRQRLVTQFDPWTARLETWLGRDLSAWRSA